MCLFLQVKFKLINTQFKIITKHVEVHKMTSVLTTLFELFNFQMHGLVVGTQNVKLLTATKILKYTFLSKRYF